MIEKINYSLCCPIYNEAKYLPYVIPSWLRLNPGPSEFILVFDRCSDRSEEICQKYLKNLKHKFIIKGDLAPDWNSQIAYNRHVAFNSANFNIILNTDADTILDPKIMEYLRLVGCRFDMISFRRINYPLDYRFWLRINYPRPYLDFSSAIYFFWKPTWKKVGFDKRVMRSDDTTLMVQLKERGFRYCFESHTRSIHLRKTGGFSSQDHGFTSGVERWKFQHSPVWKVVLSTLIHRKPKLLVGYLYARRKTKES